MGLYSYKERIAQLRGDVEGFMWKFLVVNLEQSRQSGVAGYSRAGRQAGTGC